MKIGRLLWLVAAFTAAPALAGPGFAPGHWHHETRLIRAEVPGIPQWLIRLFASHSTRESCHDAAGLATHPEALLTADDRAHCTLRRFTATEGHLEFDTFCTNHHFPEGLLVSSRGTYTATAYQITTISTGTHGGRPVRIETIGVGQQIGRTCAVAQGAGIQSGAG